MRKVVKDYTKRYPLQRLYRDDLEEIINIFQENFAKFDVCIDDYQLDDIKEIDTIKKSKLKYLRIQYYQSDTGKKSALLYLQLSKDGARLHLSDDSDTPLNGVALKIDRLILSKKCLIGKITSHWGIKTWSIITLQLIINALIWGMGMHSPISIVLGYANFIITSSSTFWVLWSSFMLLRRHSIIYMAHSSSKTNFFSRKGDDIILSLISALVGFGLGVLATIITTSMIHTNK